MIKEENIDPIISVIIPSYNHVTYLAEAVTSILQQSFKDWELIIIDDASQDDSPNWLKELSDPRISTYFHEENQGAALTINEALHYAKGEYISILNSDDIYHSERLSVLHQVAQQNKCDFIASDLHLVDHDSCTIEESDNEYIAAWLDWYHSLKEVYHQSQEFLTTLLSGNFLITTSNFFFHRRVLEQLVGFHDLRYVHDYEFILRLQQSSYHAYWLPKKLLSYRWHNNNTIREAPLKAIEENTHLLITQIKKNDLEIKHLNALNAQLNQLYQHASDEWGAITHHKLVHKEKELFGLIRDRDNWIIERDNIINEKESQLNEQQQLLADRDQIIKKQGRWIKERNQWVADRDKWVKERDQIIINQKKWIKDRDQWIIERDQLISALQNELNTIINNPHYQRFVIWQNRWQRFRHYLRGFLGRVPKANKGQAYAKE
ncbi:MAG: glycosyltransferase [bacterium]